MENTGEKNQKRIDKYRRHRRAREGREDEIGLHIICKRTFELCILHGKDLLNIIA